jgi:molybdopterin synthase catalytic subunit
MTFEITFSAIDPTHLEEKLAIPQTGAIVVFSGIVRNINNGKKVTQIEYEMFQEMVKIEAEKLLKMAKEKFEIQAASAHHRAGIIKVGETAIWVGVSSQHRKAAFDACSWLMNNFKHQLPIWKKESYAEGSPEWVFCKHH